MISPLLFWIRTGLFVLGAILLCFFIYFAVREYQLIYFEKNILSEPVQKRILFGKKWTEQGFEITPRAKYKIAGKIMSTNPIRDMLTLSPLDLSIVWGKMTDENFLPFFSWQHQGRVLYPSFSAYIPLDQETITRNLGNIHTVPANQNIKKQLEEISAGDEVFFSGKLVDIKNLSTGWHWESSLSRDDWGIALGASCELFWIEEVEILAKAPKKPSPQNISQNEDNVENATFEVVLPTEK